MMTEKRYSHNGVVIIDHLKKDLIYIDGKKDLLELAEYVDKLEDKNEQLKKENQSWLKTAYHLDTITHEDRNYAERMYNENKELKEANKELKASLYAEKTNTAEVVNEYAKQFKRYSAQFSFMIDLAKDLGVDVRKLEALDD